MNLASIASLALALPILSQAMAQQVSIHGRSGLRRWHAVALELRGPMRSELGSPNPFLDERMTVTFGHPASGTQYVVPGHFAADGDAAESSATAGDRWRAWLSPDHAGTWTWSISFRSGSQVAISLDPTAGTPRAPFDGLNGSFEVLETDKSGRDHRARGRLSYVGAHQLRYADGGWFVKAGADSPENLLAYDDIDNTPDIGGRRKSWAPHVGDARSGDPVWQGNKGRGLLGALNYLESKGLNAFSFLTYSHNGDDKNIFPHVDPNDRVRMDCSKLDQWDRVFDHADALGLFMHFKTQETENDQDMDGGALGVERRLYYRELVSRFAHHLALNWNLGEENTNTSAQRIAFADYFSALDPYDHPIVVHTFPGQKDAVYTPLLGTASALAGASLQSRPSSVFSDTLTWRQRSAAAGRPWVVANDEQGNAQTGIRPDANDPTHDDSRADVLWGNLIAGGAGIESYFGYGFAHSDLTCEDFRSRDTWWDQCRHALDLFRVHRVPVQEMSNDDSLVTEGHCLAGPDVWVVYLENGGTSRLDLTRAASNTYYVRWYNPRTGGPLRAGSIPFVVSGTRVQLGFAPADQSNDWVVLVRPTNFVPARTTNYGSGCGGSAGGPTPRLVAEGQPALRNRDFALRVLDARGATGAALLLGFDTPVAIPIGAGCDLLVPAEVSLSGATDSSGAGRFHLPVPLNPAVQGLAVQAQALMLVPQGPALGLADASDAIELTIGR